MKIVHFSECGGGVERYLQMLIPRLEDKGVKQVLICSQHFSMKNFPSMADSFYKIYVEQSFSFFKIPTPFCFSVYHNKPLNVMLGG